MATNKLEAELWVGWTHDALGVYEKPDSVEDAEELIDDMVDVATEYADAMMDEYTDRFDASPGRKKKRRKKRRSEEEDPE